MTWGYLGTGFLGGQWAVLVSQQQAPGRLDKLLVDVGGAVVVADELGEDDVVENGGDYRLLIRDRVGDDEERVLEEEFGEERLQKFFAIDVFAFIGLAQRDERDEGVVAVAL